MSTSSIATSAFQFYIFFLSFRVFRFHFLGLTSFDLTNKVVQLFKKEKNVLSKAPISQSLLDLKIYLTCVLTGGVSFQKLLTSLVQDLGQYFLF